MNDNKLEKSDVPKETRTLRPSLPPELGRKVGHFQERLKGILKGKSVRDFGRKAGISEGAIRHYLNGDSFPDLDRLASIAHNAGVNLLWLATGEGPKHGETTTCAGDALDEEALARALEVVEEVGAGVPPERKARLGAAIYSLYIRSGEAVDPALVEEVVRSARGDSSQSM